MLVCLICLGLSLILDFVFAMILVKVVVLHELRHVPLFFVGFGLYLVPALTSVIFNGSLGLGVALVLVIIMVLGFVLVLFGFWVCVGVKIVVSYLNF